MICGKCGDKLSIWGVALPRILYCTPLFWIMTKYTMIILLCWISLISMLSSDNRKILSKSLCALGGRSKDGLINRPITIADIKHDSEIARFVSLVLVSSLCVGGSPAYFIHCG